MKALLYLNYRQFVNSIKRIVSSSKRLIPALLIILWIGFTMISNIGNTGQSSGYEQIKKLALPPADAIWAGVFSLLFMWMLYVLYSAFAEGLLIFSQSHVDFLFPSPVSRKSVLVFKLIEDYLRYAFTAGFVFVFAAPSFYRMAHTKPYPGILISWLAVLLLLIFMMNLSHTLKLITSVGIQRLKVARRIVKIFVLVAVIAVVAAGLVQYLKTDDIIASISGAVRSSFASIVFMPVTWATNLTVGQALRQDYGSVGMQLIWLALLAAGSMALLLSRAENYYEPSLAISTRFSKIKEAVKSGNLTAARTEMAKGKIRQTSRRSLIPAFGNGASVLLWKILVQRIRMSGWQLALFYGALPLAAFTAGRLLPDSTVLKYSPVALPYAAWWMTTVFGFQGMQSELRQTEIIKTLPDTGFRIVLTLAVMQWLGIFIFVLTGAFSIGMFIPNVNLYLLGILAAASAAGSFTCISGSVIPALLYSGNKDKLAMTIPGCLSLVIIILLILPTAVIAGVAGAFKTSLFWSVIALVVVNALLSCGALAIAGSMLKNSDPNEG